MTQAPPEPTLVYRLVHVDNLPVLLTRRALHAPNHTPADGQTYRTIHNTAVQATRRATPVPCGPGGTVHDYVPFYFGPRSVMLLNLHTGRVPGYTEGQEPLVYLVARAQQVTQAGQPFVFTDGHGLAKFTQWFTDLHHLDTIDWALLKARYWQDTPEDNDRQRRKQAEFLVWQSLPWDLLAGIGVQTEAMRLRVEQRLQHHPDCKPLPVKVLPHWYY